MPGEYRIVGQVHDELIINDPWPMYGGVGHPDEITYRFVNGKGWVSGYWSVEDEAIRRLQEEMSRAVFETLMQNTGRWIIDNAEPLGVRWTLDDNE